MFVADNAVLYGFAGVGTHSANGTYIPVGAGVEFGVADNMSLKAEYQFNYDLSSAAPIHIA